MSTRSAAVMVVFDPDVDPDGITAIQKHLRSLVLPHGYMTVYATDDHDRAQLMMDAFHGWVTQTHGSAVTGG